MNSELLPNFSSSFDKMKIDFLFSRAYYSDRKSRQQDGDLQVFRNIPATFGCDGGDVLYPEQGQRIHEEPSEASESNLILFLSYPSPPFSRMGLGGLLPRDAGGHRLTSADDLCILTEEEESTQASFSIKITDFLCCMVFRL